MKALSITRSDKLAIMLIGSLPIVHNLHRLVGFDLLKQFKITFYQNWYLFLFIIEHNLAPTISLLGCLFIVERKYKAYVSIAVGYEMYKTIEKIPFKGDYHVYDEYLLIGIGFTIAFSILTYFLYHEHNQKNH